MSTTKYGAKGGSVCSKCFFCCSYVYSFCQAVFLVFFGFSVVKRSAVYFS